MRLFFLFIIFLFLSSCSNVLEDMSAGAKNTEAAILYSARMHLAQGSWDDALSDFARLAPATLAQPEVLVDHASAYSGRCGLDFLDLASHINDIGSAHLMTMLMKLKNVTSTSHWVDCKAAETLLKNIMDPTTKVVATERGQFLMAFNSLAKIGAILNYRADTNKDGTPDPAWDPCDAGTGPTDLPLNEVNEIATGLNLFYNNLKGSSYGGSIVGPMTTICSSGYVPIGFCQITEVTDPTLDNTVRAIVRALVVETTDGIGLSLSMHPSNVQTEALSCL